MIRIRRILAVLLVISFFFNTTAVLAVSSYNVDNTRGVWTISIEKEKDYLEKEKERLQKKFLNIKEQMQGTKVYESFFGKNQT